LLFPGINWGGKRRGAGRKARGKRSGIRHGERHEVKGTWPMHVVWHLVDEVASIRKKEVLDILVKALKIIKMTKDDFRILHYSIQKSLWRRF